MLDLSFPNPTACSLNNLKVQIAMTNMLALLQEQQVQVKKSDLAQHPLGQCGKRPGTCLPLGKHGEKLDYTDHLPCPATST